MFTTATEILIRRDEVDKEFNILRDNYIKQSRIVFGNISKHLKHHIASSSSGRTSHFDCENCGSSPREATNK